MSVFTWIFAFIFYIKQKTPRNADGGGGGRGGDAGGAEGWAILTMPSLSGDPLEGTEKGAVLVPKPPQLTYGNRFVNEFIAAKTVIMALSAHPSHLPLVGPTQGHGALSLTLSDESFEV